MDQRTDIVRTNPALALRLLIRTLLEGQNPELPASAFVPVYARRLRHARVLWVNWPFLRTLGFDLGGVGLTPAIERVLLQAFAYRIPAEDDDASTFIGAPRRFRADRYGGDGVAPNTGSGRAAAMGRIQLKGIGTTPLASPETPVEHRHGSLHLGAALREAAWSELNHLETPHGSNRVLAIIDVGSTFTLPDGRRRRRALLVRLLPLRPAHFMLNPHSRLGPAEHRRLQQHLARALPVPGDQATRPLGERIRLGFLELAARSARQHATLMARRAPHGALSSSNLELDAKLLDFETQSTQPGHGATLAIRGSVYRSDSAASLGRMLRDLAFAAALGLPEALSRAVPSAEELDAKLTESHAQALLHELLGLCGFPVFLLSLAPASAAYLKLATRIHELAFETGDPIVIERGVPAWTGTYDVGALLVSLARVWRKGMTAAAHALGSAGANPQVLALLEAYIELRGELEQAASAHGLSGAELDELIVRVASVRNEKRPALYLPQLQKKTARILIDYVREQAPALVEQRVEGLIEDNRRFFEESPEHCVIREWSDRRTGARVRYAYLPRIGYILELLAPLHGTSVGFFGPELALPQDAALQASVRLTTAAGTTSRQRFTLTRWGAGVRLVIGLDAEVVRFGVRLESASRGGPHTWFEPLPASYFRGVTQVQRDTKLPAPIAAQA